MEEFEKEYLKITGTNIISWYNFKENSDIYVLGENIDKYVNFLKTKTSNIFSKDIFNSEKIYDYIIVFENLEIIDSLKKYLKPNGIILLIVSNKFGIKRFAIVDEFENTIKGLGKGYTKNQIENKLEECEYKNYKFYYPLPDYNVTNIIFSDDYLPEYNNTKLINNYYYPENTKLLFREGILLKEITKSEMFADFTNSYFIEINNKSPEKFIGFNNLRKDEYRLCTKIYNDYVIKESININDNKQINRIIDNIEILNKLGIKTLDFNKENKIYSKFMPNQTLDQKIVDLILNNDINDAIQMIEEYYQFLKERFRSDKIDQINLKYFENIEDISNLYIIKNGVIDLVFENVFKIDDEYLFFDQEWFIENIPLEFVLYRAINNMYIYNAQIENKLSREDIYIKFEIEKYISHFKIAEQKFQQDVVDQRKINIYETRQNNILSESGNILELLRKLELEKNNLEEKNKILENNINLLNAKNANLENEIRTSNQKNIDLENEIKLLNQKKLELENEIKLLNEKNIQLHESIEKITKEVEKKQLTINYYENMRVVKLMRKLKNK